MLVFVSTLAYAQKRSLEVIRTYNVVTIYKNSKSESLLLPTVIYFNYKNEPYIKISNTSYSYLYKILPEEGKEVETDGVKNYQFYTLSENGKRIMFAVYNDEKFGIMLTDGELVVAFSNTK